MVGPDPGLVYRRPLSAPFLRAPLPPEAYYNEKSGKIYVLDCTHNTVQSNTHLMRSANQNTSRGTAVGPCCEISVHRLTFLQLLSAFMFSLQIQHSGERVLALEKTGSVTYVYFYSHIHIPKFIKQPCLWINVLFIKTSVPVVFVVFFLNFFLMYLIYFKSDTCPFMSFKFIL